MVERTGRFKQDLKRESCRFQSKGDHRLTQTTLESSWCVSALPASRGFEQLNRLSRTPVASGHGAKKRQRLAENRCVALAAIVAQAWDPRLEGSFGSVLASSAP